MNERKDRKKSLFVAATCAALLLALAPAASAVDVADVQAYSGGIDFQPKVEYAALVLTVSGPDGYYHRAEFKSGQSPAFAIFEQGHVLPDGVYKYELRVVPTDARRREAFEANNGPAEKGRGGIEPLVQAGAFSIIGGAAVAGGAEEPDAGFAKPNGVAVKDQVIPDDLIVQGSLCVGFDCVNNESFGFDTIRLKENNTRIKFEDTSSTSGFPSNDWQLTANDSASGGLNKFSIEDITGARVPFTIEGGSSTNSIYVDSTGRVGFRTSTPVLDLHVSTTNTPAMRLEQTSAGGFTAQTWDIAGNEANFFVRDVTGGSRLPFRIRPGAPTSSIDIAASGNIGIGTASPGNMDNSGDAAAVHIRRTADNQGGLLIERATGAAASDVLLELKNNGTPRFDMIDTNSGTEWRFEASGAGFNINDLADGGSAEFVVQTDGDVIIEGSLTVGAGGCTGCDLVFSPEYEVESIEEHAAYMWANRHLPGVGPTPEDQPMNLSKKTGGILNELEKAHIYIEELHGTILELKAEASEKDQVLQVLEDRLARLESTGPTLE